MIESQYNETVTVNRLTDIADSNKRGYTEHIASLKCCVQPLDNSISQDIEGGFGKEFLMFCEPADIQEGDRIMRDHGGDTKEYRVTAVESLDFLGNPHMEVNIRIFES